MHIMKHADVLAGWRFTRSTDNELLPHCYIPTTHHPQSNIATTTSSMMYYIVYMHKNNELLQE
jgi:hypothetical protein